MIGALVVLGIAGLTTGIALKKHKAIAVISTVIAMIAAFVAFPQLSTLPLSAIKNVTFDPIWAWVAVIIAGLVTALLVIKKSPWALVSTVIMVWALFLALPNLTVAFANLGSNVATTAKQFFDDLVNSNGAGTTGDSPSPSPAQSASSSSDH